MKSIDMDFEDVKKALKSLSKIEAPSNFEQSLMNKINEVKDEKESSFWSYIFEPSKLIPAAGLAAIVLFLVTNFLNPTNTENPLLTNPRVRQDIIPTKLSADKSLNNSSTVITNKSNDFDISKIIKVNPSLAETNKDNPNLGITITGNNPKHNSAYPGGVLTSVSPNGFVTRRRFDYRQMPLSKREKLQIEMMRKKIEGMLKKSER